MSERSRGGEREEERVRWRELEKEGRSKLFSYLVVC